MFQCNEEVSVNQNTYKIIKLLGHGKGGYSYLAQKDGKNFVVKQIHHEPCSYYSFGNKIELGDKILVQNPGIPGIYRQEFLSFSYSTSYYSPIFFLPDVLLQSRSWLPC